MTLKPRVVAALAVGCFLAVPVAHLTLAFADPPTSAQRARSAGSRWSLTDAGVAYRDYAEVVATVPAQCPACELGIPPVGRYQIINATVVLGSTEHLRALLLDTVTGRAWYQCTASTVGWCEVDSGNYGSGPR